VVGGAHDEHSGWADLMMSDARHGQAELVIGRSDGWSSRRAASMGDSQFEAPGSGDCWNHHFPISLKRPQDGDAGSGPVGDNIRHVTFETSYIITHSSDLCDYSARVIVAMYIIFWNYLFSL
jgi:hypothetical protein